MDTFSNEKITDSINPENITEKNTSFKSTENDPERWINLKYTKRA